MYSLAFNTADAACGIIIAEDGKPVDVFEQSMDFGQAEVLMPQIKKMLATRNLKFADLEALFVCVGPGSFTGVRSGIAAARTFAFARPDLKVGGISAFDAYMQTFEDTELAERNAIIIETRRDDFYVQVFDKCRQPLLEPQSLKREDVIALLKKNGGLVSVAGDGVERFLNSPSGLPLHAVKIFDYLPSQALLKAGLRALSEQKLNYPKPLYLRAPDVCLPKV